MLKIEKCSSFLCCWPENKVTPSDDRVVRAVHTRWPQRELQPPVITRFHATHINSLKEAVEDPERLDFREIKESYSVAHEQNEGVGKFKADFDTFMEMYRELPPLAFAKYQAAFGLEGTRHFTAFMIKEDFSKGAKLLSSMDVPKAVIAKAISSLKTYPQEHLKPFLDALSSFGVSDGPEMANFILTYQQYCSPRRDYFRKEQTQLSHTVDIRSDGTPCVLIKSKVGEGIEVFKKTGAEKSVTLAVLFDGKIVTYSAINASAMSRRSGFTLDEARELYQKELYALKKFAGFTPEDCALCTLEEHVAIKAKIKWLHEKKILQFEKDVIFSLTVPLASGGDFLESEFPALPFSVKIRKFCDIAETLALMHDEGWVHRDVKLENALLYDDRARLIDFGFATTAEQAAQDNSDKINVGTQHLSAPEALVYKIKGADNAKKAEVYTYGMFLFEALIENSTSMELHCYYNTNDAETKVLQKVAEEAKKFGAEYQKVFGLIERILSFDPNRRPTMREVFKEMQSFYS